MTPTELISQIRALLEKATPGEWSWRWIPGESHILESDAPVNCASSAIVLSVQVGHYPSVANGRLIAAAPTLLAACADALEGMEMQLNAEVDLMAVLTGRDESARADAAEAEVQRLKERVAKLSGNCTDCGGFSPTGCHVCITRGERMAARIAELEAKVAMEHAAVEMMADTARSLNDRIAQLEVALKLIAAIPAFPSKDIADKALGTQGPDWEPKAVKAYNAALSQARGEEEES
jgi:hypothetical protein